MADFFCYDCEEDLENVGGDAWMCPKCGNIYIMEDEDYEDADYEEIYPEGMYDDL